MSVTYDAWAMADRITPPVLPPPPPAPEPIAVAAPAASAQAATPAPASTVAVRLPVATPPRAESVPAELRDLRAWVLWKFEPPAKPGAKPRKVPYYANGRRRSGQQGAPTDRAALVTFDQARGALRPGFGMGLAMLPEHGLVGLDFDGCIVDGVVDPEIERAVGVTYAEVSPSGQGVRAFMRGEAEDRKVPGCEVFHRSGFLTITGNTLPACDLAGGELVDMTDAARALLTARMGLPTRDRDAGEPSAKPNDLERAVALSDVTDQTVADFRDALQHLDADDRKLWVDVGHAAKSLEQAGRDDAFEVWSAWSAMSDKHDDDEARAKWDGFDPTAITYRSVFKLAADAGWENPRTLPASPDDFGVIVPEAGADLVPMPTFERDESNRVKVTLDNVWRALSDSRVCGWRVRYDAFRGEEMIAPHGTDEWRPVSNADLIRLRRILEKDAGAYRFKRDVGREYIRDALRAVADDNRWDSAQHWLRSLVWDGVPRIERFFPAYLSTDDSRYAHELGLYLWTAFAGRVMEPGLQVDIVPILFGAQGLRKTSAIRAMVPAREHYAEIPLDGLRDADLSRRMRGLLVGELAEMQGLATRSADAIKAFITKRDERWTPKYIEQEVVVPRRCVFIGTTNEDTFLDDNTGNRRWAPIKVGACDTDAIERDREQLWAEGAALFAAGGVRYAELEKLATAEHAAFEVEDSWHSTISRWIDTPDELSGERPGDRPLRAVDVLEHALRVTAIQQTQAAQRRVYRSLRLLGFNRSVQRIAGTPSKCWIRA